MKKNLRKVAFVWDNFGPMHADRCDAVAQSLPDPHAVVGIELFSRSGEYDWNSEQGSLFKKITLHQEKNWQDIAPVKLAYDILRACQKENVTDVFLCNYDKMAIFFSAILLRAVGKSVYIMGCSKFDDFRRSVWKEALKRYIFLSPYQGAIASGIRSKDYMRFLGIQEKKIFSEYNTLSIERIRSAAGEMPAPNGTAFRERHFTIIARFLPKKNLLMAIEAYSLYCRNRAFPRPLHLCGSGPLRDQIVDRVKQLGLENLVVFRGFLQSDEIAKVLAKSLVLILPSVEEQFGNVVIEAQVMGLPVLLSDACGARDNLVRTAVNGFVFEPDNPHGLSYFMGKCDEDEVLWRDMATQALNYAELGSSRIFANAVNALMRS